MICSLVRLSFPQQLLTGGVPSEWTLPCTVPRDFSSSRQLCSRLSSMSATGSQVTWRRLLSDRYKSGLKLCSYSFVIGPLRYLRGVITLVLVYDSKIAIKQ